jgi:tetratricopeptide (TPR) repeat protein
MASRTSNLVVLALLAAGMVLAILAVFLAYREHYAPPKTPELPPQPQAREYSDETVRLTSRAGDLVSTDPAESLRLLSEAIRKDPEYYRAHADKGYLLADLERYEEAEVCFRKATELRPRDSDYYVDHAMCLSRLKRETEAQSQLLYALAAIDEQFNGKAAGRQPTRAVILFLMRRDQLAHRELDAIKQADPDAPRGALAARLLTAMDRLKDNDRWQILRMK